MPYSSPAPWQGQGSGPTGEQGWLFFPTALPPDLAVTRAQLRHPLLCGGFLLVLKGKRTQEGAATPCLEPFWGAAPRMQPHPTPFTPQPVPSQQQEWRQGLVQAQGDT